MSRKERELRTVEVMIDLYCRNHHGGAVQCEECGLLKEYVRQRLEQCPHGAHKRSCRVCEIHCYLPLRRQQIQQVMRYAGPRMMFRHPIMALLHLWNETRRR